LVKELNSSSLDPDYSMACLDVTSMFLSFGEHFKEMEIDFSQHFDFFARVQRCCEICVRFNFFYV